MEWSCACECRHDIGEPFRTSFVAAIAAQRRSPRRTSPLTPGGQDFAEEALFAVAEETFNRRLERERMQIRGTAVREFRNR